VKGRGDIAVEGKKGGEANARCRKINCGCFKGGNGPLSPPKRAVRRWVAEKKKSLISSAGSGWPGVPNSKADYQTRGGKWYRGESGLKAGVLI